MLRTSILAGWMRPLEALSEWACSTIRLSSSLRMYSVGRLRAPKVRGTHPAGIAPGFPEENRVIAAACFGAAASAGEHASAARTRTTRRDAGMQGSAQVRGVFSLGSGEPSL